jgi:hypothetical protein
MKHILTLTAALLLSACTSTPPDCRQSLYGCNEGRAVASDAARPATPTKPEKPTERPGPIKPDKPAGHKPGHGHGDKNHGHSGPRGHGKGGRK